MFTLDEKAEMYKMRQSGSTLQEIADAYSITREAVRNILDCTKKGIPKKNVMSCVYPAIREWMTEEEMSIKKMSAIVGVSTATMTSKLNGEKAFKQNEIDTICKITGMAYEVAFCKEEKEDESV